MTDRHRYFLERLSHFHCGACGRWWTIGDAPTGRAWFCPWCGEWRAAEEETEDDATA